MVYLFLDHVFLPCSVFCNAGVIGGMLGRRDCAQTARKVYTDVANVTWQSPLHQLLQLTLQLTLMTC